MERYYKPIFFLAFCVLALSISVMTDEIKTIEEITALEQQITQHREQISTLEEQIFDLRSKMPQNQSKVLDEDLPTKEKMIETDEEYEVSRGAKRGTPILMRVTAYDLSYASCKKYPSHPEYGIGTSGKRVREHHSVAAGPELPFGTKVFIPALKDKPSGGIYTVEDRGKAIKENCLDIFLGESKYDECMEFGVQYLEVYILGGEGYERN